MSTSMKLARRQQQGKDAWKARSLRSGFGAQCLATKASSPACGFGSSNRDAFTKVASKQLVIRAHEGITLA